MAIDIIARGIAVGLEAKVDQIIGIDVHKLATKDELAEKLNKHEATDGLLVAYVANNGVQEVLPITSTAQPEHLAMLDELGNIQLADPTLPQHAVTKNYIDSSLADLVRAEITRQGVATDESLGMVKGSEEVNGVTVNGDGTMTINQVSATSLYQAPGEELILDGSGAIKV